MMTICDQAMESEDMGFGESLSPHSPPPPKKARVENKADELEEAYKKFAKEVKQSEGFDIQTFPDITKFIGGVLNVPFDLKELYKSEDTGIPTLLFYKFGCIFSLNYAISKENQKQKKKLVLDKIIKSNCETVGDVYYTTFLAKDADTGESKIYQTKVWFSMIDAETEVYIFRERADQALQPGEDTQGVDMEVFPNLPAPGDALCLVNLDLNVWNEDAYYLVLCYLSIRFALRVVDEREIFH